MSSKRRKTLFCWSFFFVVPILINWQKDNFVFCADPEPDFKNLPTFDLIKKQSETCGQLDIIPNDVRTFAPWSAAIYRKTKGKWIFHTSGTILSSGLVYSVQAGEAGRFPSDKNPGNFFIATGINSTDFNSHDRFAQYSRVLLIEPYISDYNVYTHVVLYHLDLPLDVINTPFVRDICYPFFAYNSQFKDNLIEAVGETLRFELIHFGFARSTTSANFNKENLKESEKKLKRKLKLWNEISLPAEICEALFRFYYGNSSFVPVCIQRNLENIPGFVSIIKILDKLQVPDSNDDDDDDDEFLCHGPGSGSMFNFGNGWFLGVTVWMVPSMKKLRCNRNTVYFGGVSKPEALDAAARFIYNIFKCPHGKFSCKDAKKCVNISQTCDEKIDCDDSSDEDPILCEWKWKGKKRENSQLINYHGLQFQSEIHEAINLNETVEPKNLSKRCPNLKFPTEGVRCRLKDTLKILDCATPFFYGIEILVDCDDYHFAPKFTTQSMNLFCNFETQWTGLEKIVCQKKRGIYNPGSKKNEKYTGFPWEAAIFKNGVHVCGGSLIQDNFILSHAKCVKHWIEFPGQRSDLHVFIRPVSSIYEENRRSNFANSTKIKDVWFSVNDLEDKYESGIALIKLETPVFTNRKNAPMAVCSLIPPFSKVSLGEIGKISTSYKEEQNVRNFHVVAEKECDAVLNGRSIINENEFCAASTPTEPETETKTEGDLDVLGGSGLNFVEKTSEAVEDSIYVLQGIASKSGNGHTVFLQVNSFSDWIIDILETNS